MKEVAVLGCGPTGLLVAWAVEQAGHRPHILSIREKSVIPGSQHLHGPVPGLTSPYPEGTIQFVRIGTAEAYARKVYGDSARETGWDNYLQVFPSWKIIPAYDRLWEHFFDRIEDRGKFDACYDTESLREIVLGHAMTITTLPINATCWKPDRHKHKGAGYVIRTLPTPEADREHEIVVYNGLPQDRWYRWSILGGVCSIEYPNDIALPDRQDWIRGYKAISTNCDCWPQMQRCGRWSEWRHGVTMYKAYQKACALMQEGPWLR